MDYDVWGTERQLPRPLIFTADFVPTLVRHKE